MTYISLEFYIFLVVIVALYYIFPLRFRWVVLFIGSIAFYLVAYAAGWWIVLITVVVTYGAGLLMDYLKKKYPVSQRRLKKIVLALALFSVIAPWFVIKNGSFAANVIGNDLSGRGWNNIIVPLGISFYTLQIVSYLTDIYLGKITAQKNPAKYALFVLFFPQIVQGPIPRYKQLAGQLYEGHFFDEKGFVKGIHLIIWGFFLKLMIADKANIVVSTIFDNTAKYTGCYVLVAGILYSIELYTDFLSCVTIAQGVAGLFGITLADNFRHPYSATSLKEFWRRWHISLSEWLRDYVYIPLGGSKKGRIARYGNLVITFVVSGIWHGAGYKFVVWGLMQAVYQIAGELTISIRNRLYHLLALSEQSGMRKMLQRIGVLFWCTLSWIIFRADNLRSGIKMLQSLFLVHNPWILFNDSLLELGLDWKEWCILIISIIILLFVSYAQECGLCIRDEILKKSIYARWFLYIAAIIGIMIFGTYGFGFNAQEFIYGGF